MSKVKKFDNQLFNDSAIVAIVGGAATNVAVGGSWLVGAGIGLLLVIPAVFGIAILGALLADPPSQGRAALLWFVFSAVLFEVVRQVGALPLFALALAAVTFFYGTSRSYLTLHRLALAGVDPLAVPAAGAAPAALPSVPEDLPQEIKAIVDGAQQDFRHLCDALGDPSLAAAAGVDVAGMRGEAEQMVRDIQRRAALVARVRRIAAERPDDAPARKSSDDALAALRRQADALRAAASAALQVAAAEVRDTALLREHTDNLHLLRETREEVRGA